MDEGENHGGRETGGRGTDSLNGNETCQEIYIYLFISAMRIETSIVPRFSSISL